MASAPGETNRLFLVGLGGVVLEATNLSSPVFRTYLDIQARTFAGVESGLLGMAFHPGFQTNGWFFVYYSWMETLAGVTNTYNRLSRFTVPREGDGLPDPNSETILFSQLDPGLNHNAGCLQFGPDGYLYLGVGDGSVWDDRITQRIDRGFFGGILRLDVDRRPENLPPNPGYGSNPEAYSVPRDNPFVGRTEYLVGDHRVWSGLDPASLRTEFFAIGMRNPWQFSFDPATGDLWANDVGNGAREEINRVLPGLDYGWPWSEGTLPLVDPPVTAAEPPVFEYSHFSGRIAITASRFYRGTNYPSLDGAYLFCDWTGDLGALRAGGTNPPSVHWFSSLGNTVSFGADPRDGALLLTPSPDGKVKKLVAEPAGGQEWPARLSELGVFENLKTLSPRPGLVPYEVSNPFWSDFAIKRRWFALPGSDSRITFRRDQPWSFPAGTVWVKHFDRPYYRPTGSPFRTETRILVKTESGVSGASYRWNDAGTEAELVPAGGTTAIFNVWSGDSLVPQTWRFPGRSECLRCHDGAQGGAAGFNTVQLNRQVRRGVHLLSQLDAMVSDGYFENPPTNTFLLPALSPTSDETVSVESRVRSYFAANCVQCHHPGALNRASWDARPGIPLDAMGLLEVAESVPIGTNRMDLISPGKPEQSALYLRISALGANHMPPLATYELDAASIRLIERWIREVLPSRQGYRQWAEIWLRRVTEVQAARTSDPDGDGLDNYTEYLLKENPRSGDRWWRPRITLDGPVPRMVFPRLTGRKFELEWTDRLGSDAVWSRYEQAENDPRTVIVEGTAAIPLPDDTNHFYRVRISED
jgi:glucose/arabinose dehydrogenase/mono/diheme cytochrome c family protein